MTASLADPAAKPSMPAGAPRLLSDIPRLGAIRDGDKVAIRCDGRALTYAELDRRVERACDLLVAAGVAPGDRVAWFGRTHEVFFELLFGAARARACLTPINTRLAIPEIAFILDDSTAGLLFVTEDLRGAAEAVLEAVARPIRLIVVGAAAHGGNGYEALCDAAPAAAERDERPEDDVVQLYTSGTTGLPKGVRLTNRNFEAFLATATAFEGLDYRKDDILLTAMPMFHVGGVNPALAALMGGATLVAVPVFDPPAVLRLIEAERATCVGFVPSMINLLLQAPGIAEIDFSSVRALVYGASPIGEAVLRAARDRFGCSFLQMYGMTESCAGGTVLVPEDHRPELLRSCGRPWPSLEVRVAGADGSEVPLGDIGEVWIRGATVMAGYWNRPRETAEAIGPDGWLRTGDAGYRDAAGYVFLHDRVKDMIVTGGENVYPAEVENAIMGCPGVADVAVIGVPDQRWGEAVKAVVVLSPGAKPSPAEILAWARARIAGYKVPKSVDFVEVLPRNASGKVLRRELRRPHWEGHGRQVG